MQYLSHLFMHYLTHKILLWLSLNKIGGIRIAMTETDYVRNKAIRSMLTLFGKHLRILNKTS